MIFRKATQEDLDFVRENPFEGMLKDYPHLQIPDKNCITAIWGEKIVGIGGLMIYWNGRGRLWLMMTADCKKDGLNGVIALSTIREKIEELIIGNNLWRVEATIECNFTQAIKMIEFLGFKRESKMKYFLPDKSDAYMYVRIL